MTKLKPIWIDYHLILAVQKSLLAEHGGIEGIRDESLFASALARPENLLAYGNPSLFDLASAYTFGIAKNHPFLDGNKRTAFMVAYIFLVRNGYEPHMNEAETVLVMNNVAAGRLSEKDFSKWLANNCITSVNKKIGTQAKEE